MMIRKLNKCKKITAGDGSFLRELLHAGKGKFSFGYSLAHAIVKPGKSTKPHMLSLSEVYYILEGRGAMYIGGKKGIVKKDDAVYIPPKAKQYIRNTGKRDLKFLCIVDPAWRASCEKICVPSKTN
ncbi:MAG: cupin domain-containing protein [Candidatus Omnitrophica bacterium]|nr:cupin domain-containing protein [Candidatus Omnitrophota bacterium]